MGYHKRDIAILPFFFGVLLSAQTDSSDAALAHASDLLGSSTSLLIDATGHLVFVHHDAYDVVRKDHIPIEAIDADAIALTPGGTILVPCLEGRPRCAQSTIYRADQELRSSMLRIPAPADSAQATAAVSAIRSIPLSITDVASLHSETSTPSLRSNGTHSTANP